MDIEEADLEESMKFGFSGEGVFYLFSTVFLFI